MSSTRRTFLFAGVGAAALAAGGSLAWFWHGKQDAPPAAAVSALTGREFTNIEGRKSALSEYHGKILVVNFWATWCAPCREEIPLFVRLQREYAGKNVQFVGIAIDQTERVRNFAREFGVNYPLLIGGLDAVELSRRLGNTAGVLPFTVLIGRDPQKAVGLVGAITEQRMRERLDLLL